MAKSLFWEPDGPRYIFDGNCSVAVEDGRFCIYGSGGWTDVTVFERKEAAQLLRILKRFVAKQNIEPTTNDTDVTILKR
ncbi:MAG: hypothetical protein WC998_09665 [Candidatus Paceibacterota bacterium]|jgi:hypothetical protein